MSIATHAELQTAISSWLHRSDLVSYAADFVMLGESRIYADLRVRAMETSTSIAGVSPAVPSDYVELKHAYITSDTPYTKLERKKADWLLSSYPLRSAQGKPSFIAREESSFIFGPCPDSTPTTKLVYYKHLTALSSSTNSIFLSYPGLYLFAALAETAPFLKDDKRVALWEAKYAELKNRVQAESDREETSGSSLRMVPG